MKNDDNFNQQLVGFSIPVGVLSGIAAAFLAGSELSTILPQGIAGGILTAALITIIIKRFEDKFSLSSLLVAGIFAGTVSGFWLGLLTSWALDSSYLYGALTGGGIGLVGGPSIILLSNYFSNR